MYTVSIVVNGCITRREFTSVIVALNYIEGRTGHKIDALRAHSDIESGRGVTMHHKGAFIGLARYN